MIDVLVIKGTETLSRAVMIETKEQALCAARTLWDDNVSRRQGWDKKMAVYFLVDGITQRVVEGVRP